MPIAELLERAMQVIVALRWTAHHSGEVSPEVEKEVRETLALLYGQRQSLDPDSPLSDSDESSRDDAPDGDDPRQPQARLLAVD